MGEGVQAQAVPGQAPRLALHGSHVTHGFFETCITSPACQAALTSSLQSHSHGLQS